ncbi:MAG TPA: bifunctional glutamate N-acetyltransferase/amino-acid acetyltransferase ArgJ [Atribacteraceae bacterium]|nr:bifunctional glutamate N-acetyltransferase/amino-acid acetyltransferase ArgJ [Atribacteraceae bacterium]
MNHFPFQVLDTGLDVVPGFQATGVHCGIKKSKKDLAVIVSDEPAVAAGVYTRNRVVAAPVLLTRDNIQKKGAIQLIVVNSGVANACTGEKGLADARRMAEMAAREFDISDPDLVAVASTGVIGDFLPLPAIEKGIHLAREAIHRESSGHSAALAIMTTDTYPKERAVRFVIDGQPVFLAGIAKGSGMIRPNMATMLAFILTNANVERVTLQNALNKVVDRTFNRVTVDGDTSTNDMLLLLANGKGGLPLTETHPDYPIFCEGLEWVCRELARDLARDGEGATKLLTIRVDGAGHEEDARRAAFTIAESLLVKTAFFGEDPNWGRIIAALGRSSAEIRPERVTVSINGYRCVEQGRSVQGDVRTQLRAIMKERELEIVLDVGVGGASCTVWTCDLSVDYVKINSHYS